MAMKALPPLRPFPWPDWPAVLTECPPKYYTAPTPGARHRLPQIERLARALGYPELQPWQKLVVRVATEHDDDGIPIYRKIVFTLPRRPGKTALVVVVLTDGLVRTGEPVSVIYAAQGGLETADRLEKDFYPIWERTDFADAFDMTLRRHPKGDVLLASLGAWLNTWGGSEAASHGTGNLLVVGDELFAHKTMAVQTSLVPSIKDEVRSQQWWTSARGTVASVVLELRIQEGREAVQTGACRKKALAYFEWGAPDDLPEGSPDEANPEVHRLANPAIGYTLHPFKVMDAYHDLTPSEFRRTELNLVAEETVNRAIPADFWQAVQCDRRRDLVPEGGVVVGLSAEGDQRHMAAAVACDKEGNVRLVASWRLSGEDVDPMIEWVRRQARQPDLKGVAIHDPGPLSVYLPEIKAAGVKVIRYNGTEDKEACGYLFDRVAHEAISVYPDHALNDAAARAIKYPKDADRGWTFGRVDPTAHVHPIRAMALAVHAATYQRPKPKLVVFG